MEKTNLIKQLVEQHNIIRKNPASYVPHLEKHLTYFKGDVMYKPGETCGLQTNEGKAAYNECISFLKSQKALGEVTLDEQLSRAAQDHADDIGPKGVTGHVGSDGSSVDDRISRYVDWDVTIMENIDFGSSSAVEVIISLIVDDGVPSRGHRNNIFNPKAKFVGVGSGDHTEYGTCTVINYTGGIAGYKNGGKSPAKPSAGTSNNNKPTPAKPTPANSTPAKFQPAEEDEEVDMDDIPEGTVSISTNTTTKTVNGKTTKTVTKTFTMADGSQKILQTTETSG